MKIYQFRQANNFRCFSHILNTMKTAFGLQIDNLYHWNFETNSQLQSQRREPNFGEIRRNELQQFQYSSHKIHIDK